jgi:acetylornithine/succinyldiaminopimelate/putrescine aminotransferase
MSQTLFFEHQAQTTPYPTAMEVSRAEGMYIYDKEGNAYMDLVAGVSANTLGHGHPSVVQAVQEQAEQYMHVMVYGEYIQSPQYQLAHLLAQHLPPSLNCSYLVNSGCEAIEGAMKLAKRITGRTQFLSCINSYHGSSQGALSLMGTEVYKAKFRPLLPDCNRITYNDVDSLSLITKETAAVVLEPVQGATGFICPTDAWLKKVRQRCDEVGALLIFDEIQTCFGRTGKLFALETFEVTPDILCIAKGMGGGMPIGAFISSKERMGLLKENPKLGHITTFGGHPVSCAASLATLRCLLDNPSLMGSVADKEALFRKHLQHPLIKEVRGTGLMLGIELGRADYCQALVNKGYDHGIITFFFLFTNTTVRLSPPLTITEEEIVSACQKITTILDEIARS